MRFTFGMYDNGDGDDYRAVNVEVEAETVPEVLEAFLSFMKGCSYSYVDQIVAVYDSGKEVGTQP